MAYKVTLGHTPNPDIAGGYWEEPVDPRQAQKVEVATIAEASAVCREYIERNHLGAGNWAGGKITDAGKGVGRISHNSRAWDAQGNSDGPSSPSFAENVDDYRHAGKSER